jgi:hypothetical protein
MHTEVVKEESGGSLAIPSIDSKAVMSISNLRHTFERAYKDEGIVKDWVTAVSDRNRPELAAPLMEKTQNRKIGWFGKKKQILKDSDLREIEHDAYERDFSGSLFPIEMYPWEYVEYYTQRIVGPLTHAIRKNATLLNHIFVSLQDIGIEKKQWEATIPVKDKMSVLFYSHETTRPFDASGKSLKESVSSDMTLVPYDMELEDIRYLAGKVFRGVRESYMSLEKFYRETADYRFDFKEIDREIEIWLKIINNCMGVIQNGSDRREIGLASAHLNKHLLMLRESLKGEIKKTESPYNELTDNILDEVREYFRETILPALGYTHEHNKKLGNHWVLYA